MTTTKHGIHIRTATSDNEDTLTVTTPFGDIRIKVDDCSASVWAWDNDHWEGIPKPELIDVRGEQTLYFVMTDHILKNKAPKHYNILCDDCKIVIGHTDSEAESAKGGRCAECKAKDHPQTGNITPDQVTEIFREAVKTCKHGKPLSGPCEDCKKIIRGVKF